MTLIYIILSIFALNLLIFVHELFHYLAAKLVKVQSTEFAVGFGPTIFAYQKLNGKHSFFWFPKKSNNPIDSKHMSYHIKLIPLGGYVLFGRSANENGESILEDYLYIHKPWKRIVVAFAGPLGNFFFAFVLGMIVLSSYTSFTPNKIDEVSPHSYAEKLGLQKEDIITDINHHAVHNVDDIRKYIQHSSHLCLTIERNQKSLNKCLQMKADTKKLVLGVSMKISPLELPKASFSLIKNVTVNYVDNFVKMILHLDVKQMSGPVGIVNVIQQSIPNFQHLLLILILVNVALAVANLIMPFTITDGGRILMDILAIIFRQHRISTKYLDAASAVLLLSLFVFTLYLDITRLFH